MQKHEQGLALALACKGLSQIFPSPLYLMPGAGGLHIQKIHLVDSEITSQTIGTVLM